LVQEAIELTGLIVNRCSDAKVIVTIFDVFSDITKSANVLFTSQSHNSERDLDWKKLKYKGYSNLLQAFISPSRVRGMIHQYCSAQQRKITAMKKLGDLGQYYPECLDIPSNRSRSERWM
jgi:hypothetical protein